MKTCSRCGASLPEAAPLGVCPRCLLDAGRRSSGAAGEGEDCSFAGTGEGELSFLEPSKQPGVLGVFDRYRILEVIGKGATGIVMKGEDPDLRRTIALKALHPALSTSAASRERFRREAKAAAAISHEHIVTIHAVGEWRGLPYLVMAYVAGRSLERRLHEQGPPELNEILRIGLQIASGLGAAHAQGVIHRDIKPANILLENSIEKVKITDFGLAKVAAEARLTLTGHVAGTPGFMSPEQLTGKSIDERSDLFSLGCVLYSLCTGYAPFRASSMAALASKVLSETPRRIRELNASLPNWLEALVQRLMAKNPSDRFDSASQVVRELEQHLAKTQLSTGYSGVGQKAGRKARRLLVVKAGTVGLLILLGAGGAHHFVRNADQESKSGSKVLPDEPSPARFWETLNVIPTFVRPIPSPASHPPRLLPRRFNDLTRVFFVAKLASGPNFETLLDSCLKQEALKSVVFEKGATLVLFHIPADGQRILDSEMRGLTGRLVRNSNVRGGAWVFLIPPEIARRRLPSDRALPGIEVWAVLPNTL